MNGLENYAPYIETFLLIVVLLLLTLVAGLVVLSEFGKGDDDEEK